MNRKNIKILIVFGTRPEAIKMAPLIKACQAEKQFITKVCVTAQHREMLDQVLELFSITPDYDLNIMSKGQDLYDVTTHVLKGMKAVLTSFKPNLVMVHGDTTTTLATALASFYQKIDIAHVEAGLRTGDIYSPWPEEANRQLTTQLTKYHFAPTISSRNNLLKENVKQSSIIITGNTVIDALHATLDRIMSDLPLEIKIRSNIENKINTPSFDLLNAKIILITSHRRENFGQPLVNICHSLKTLANNNPEIDIIYPVHLNPNVKGPVHKLLSKVKNIHLISPLQYESFIYLMSRSYFIISDSGGIQEEAPSLGKPVLVMRKSTERPEAVNAGTVKLVDTPEKIIFEAQNLLNHPKTYQQMSEAHNPYGDGNACKKIVDFIKLNLLNTSHI